MCVYVTLESGSYHHYSFSVRDLLLNTLIVSPYIVRTEASPLYFNTYFFTYIFHSRQFFFNQKQNKKNLSLSHDYSFTARVLLGINMNNVSISSIIITHLNILIRNGVSMNFNQQLSLGSVTHFDFENIEVV